MAVYKNGTSQKVAVFAYDKTTGAAKTGDAADITAYLSKDWGAAAAVTDTNPTEMDATNLPGWYAFDLAQAETNAEVIVVAPKSATSNILLDQVQIITTDSLVATAAAVADVPTVAEFEARTLVAANYFDPATDAVANVTTVNGLAAGVITAAAIATGAIDADAIATDAVTEIQAGLALETTAQDVLAAVADVPTNAELTSALADLPTNAELATALGTADDATLAAISALNNLSQAQAQTAATAALNAYDPPTKAELDAGFAAGDDAVLAAIAALNNLSSAGAQAAAAAALAAYGAATSTNVTNATSPLATAASIAALNNLSLAQIIAGITDGTLDLQEMMRVITAAVAGKASGGGTDTITFRDTADTKDRIVATVDGDGNRSAVVIDAS